MPRRYHSSAAKCPHYKGEQADIRTGGAAVYCQGICAAETTRLFFRAKDKMATHTRRFCREAWEDCPLAQILNQSK